MVVMSDKKVTRFFGLSAGFLFVIVSSASAAFTPGIGYQSRALFDTSGQFTLIEALEVTGDDVYLGYGTTVAALNLVNESLTPIGTLPPNVSVSYVCLRDGDLHAAYGQSFASPFPARHGVLDELGVFQDLGGEDGIYDAAVDSSNNLFIMANPSSAGAKIFRYTPITHVLTEIVQVGGFSGAIAIDSHDRLYVSDQNSGNIIRFTSAQLLAGGLTAADGEIFGAISATYMCFDDQDRLYAVTGFGNQLSMHDGNSGALLRIVAQDPAFGFGIGRVGWDSDRKQVIAVFSDYGPFYSTLYALTYGFSPADSGLIATSTVFSSWIAGYENFNRPDPNSGGMPRDDDLNVVTPGVAIIGAPRDYEGFAGHFLSLGDGGSIVLSFDDAIMNGPGADFAVFENGFVDATDRPGVTGEFMFAEFAFVEVATTTNVWARFPVTYLGTSIVYNLNNVPSNRYASQDVTLVDGLAGKNSLAFGTPFDLETLTNHPSVLNGDIDLNRIGYIRLIDVIGDGSTTDQYGNPIYDPYYHMLTGYPNAAVPSITDGFDLRGIGVLHLTGMNMSIEQPDLHLEFFGLPGRSYQPQYESGGAWIDLGGLVSGTGGVHRVSITPSTDTRMYRIHQEIPFTP